jgi:signal transduction histidine kinase
MEDLLDFARPADLQRAPADAASLVAEALEIDRAEQGGGGPAIESEIAAPLPKLPLDRARIVQVLVNLIGNARKHARGATRIVVRARPSSSFAGGLRLEVADDGAGLADAVRETLFEPFVTSGAGSGLGLAIVRRIVEQHGGTVAAEPMAPHGVRFAVDLPVPA